MNTSYKKKPLVIDAWQLPPVDGEAHSCPDWIEIAVDSGMLVPYADSVAVLSKGGPVIAYPGDWIIMGVELELYPCPDSIFRASYDEVAA
jgi:hypothetical protein